MTGLECLLIFAVIVDAWWIVAAVADTNAGSCIAVRAGVDLIRQLDHGGPPLLPPPPPVLPAARVYIDMTTGAAEDTARHPSQ